MDVTTAFRPAQKFLTATIVAGVTATTLVAAASGHHGAPSPAGHVLAKKEYKLSPDKKEFVLSAKKEYKLTPDKKEYSVTG